MAKSVAIFSSNPTTGFADGSTYYIPITGRANNNQFTTEAFCQIPVRDACVFSNLWVYVSANAASVTTTLTFRVNAADQTALQVSITADATGVFIDDVGSVSVADGDEVNWSLVIPAEAGTNSIALNDISIQIDPTDNNLCFSWLKNIPVATNITSASTTEYITPSGRTGFSATEADCQFEFSDDFTSSNFFLYISANARTTTTTFRTRKDGANGGQSISVVAAATGFFEDTTNSDTLIDGSLFDYSYTTSTGTETLTITNIGSIIYGASGEAYFTLGGGSATLTVNVTTGATLYNSISGSITNADANETITQVRIPFNCTVKNFAVRAISNSNGSGACTVTIRKNGADTGVTVSFGTAVTGWLYDTTNYAYFLKGDLASVEYTNGGDGTVSFTMVNSILYLPLIKNVDEVEIDTIDNIDGVAIETIKNYNGVANIRN